MAEKWVHFDKHQGHRMKKRYTDKQRARYWKRKYFDCKHDLESLQGFKRR